MIEAILSRLNAIPADKVMHFACGAVLFACFLPLFEAWYALEMVALAALIKEAYDSMHKDNHTPDLWDAVATTAGGALTFFLYVLLKENHDNYRLVRYRYELLHHRNKSGHCDGCSLDLCRHG